MTAPIMSASMQDVRDLARVVETIYDALLGQIDLPYAEHKAVRAILERINPETP